MLQFVMLNLLSIKRKPSLIDPRKVDLPNLYPSTGPTKPLQVRNDDEAAQKLWLDNYPDLSSICLTLARRSFGTRGLAMKPTRSSSIPLSSTMSLV